MRYFATALALFAASAFAQYGAPITTYNEPAQTRQQRLPYGEPIAVNPVQPYQPRTRSFYEPDPVRTYQPTYPREYQRETPREYPRRGY